jgi:F-type H+/Na+-transporting ATPase subunit beta
MYPQADSGETAALAEGEPTIADARVVRISGQLLELRIDGPSPASKDLFVGVDDPELRVEIATLPGDGLARGLLLSAGGP